MKRWPRWARLPKASTNLFSSFAPLKLTSKQQTALPRLAFALSCSRFSSTIPGSEALEWIPLVTDNTRSMYEKAAQRDFPGVPDHRT